MLRWLAYVCVHSYTCVWLCWDSWGIKRSIYPETNSAFLLISGESDQTPGLIPYSAVPSLSKPAFTHKSLADPFLPKRLLILRFSTAQLATPCYSLESICRVLFDSIVWHRYCCFESCCILVGCLCRREGSRRVFQSTVGHARQPLPQLALSVSPNNVSSLLRMCHPPNHHISLHNKCCVLGSKVKAVTVSAFAVRTTVETTIILGMQLIYFSPTFFIEKSKILAEKMDYRVSVSNPDIPNWWKIPRHSLTIDIKVQKSMTHWTALLSLEILKIFKLKMLSNVLSKRGKS